jgi:hypothetical protein
MRLELFALSFHFIYKSNEHTERKDKEEREREREKNVNNFFRLDISQLSDDS